MKRMRHVGIYLAGFLTATVVLIGTINVWGSGVLKAIYVDDAPIKIFIDGQEKNPPDDMKPFIYNGRTYVALRYVGEAFGKQVDWNGTTRTVTIAEPKLQRTSYSESFTDSTRLSDYWTKIDGDMWRFDGPNGLLLASDGHLILNDILPDAHTNYTIEFEVAATGRGDTQLLVAFCLGKNYAGEYGDVFVFAHKYNANWSIDNTINYLSNLSDIKNRFNNTIANFPDIEVNEYISIKAQVKDRYVDLYVNGKYITSRDLVMDKSAFSFYCRTGVLVGQDISYIRNFKITLD